MRPGGLTTRTIIVASPALPLSFAAAPVPARWRSAGAVCLAGLLFLTGMAGPALALTPAAEYSVKAAFLVKFAGFVRWPETAFANAESPFVLCVIGEDPFGDSFESFRDSKVAGRALEVRLVASATEVPKSCQTLFVAASESRRLPEILRELHRTAALTVSDLDGFAAAGGMIQLFKRDQKVHFEINREAAEAGGLKIDARLLKLAEPASGTTGEARR